jgi:hypothetical protein
MKTKTYVIVSFVSSYGPGSGNRLRVLVISESLPELRRKIGENQKADSKQNLLLKFAI